MKKLATGLLVAVLLASPATAADYWHTNDYYAVELDGEGEAFVVAEIDLKSISENPTTSIDLQIPSRNTQVYKVIQKQEEYRGDPIFLDHQVERFGDSTRLRIDLARPVTSDSTREIVVVYRISDISRRTLEGRRFNFATLKDNDAVTRKVSVDVKPPESISMKRNMDAKIDYQPAMMATQSLETAEIQKSIRPRREPMGQFKARNLDPGESFRVKGTYSSSFLRLYIPEIVSGITLLIVVVFVSRQSGFPDIRQRIKPGEKSFYPLRAGAAGLAASVLFAASLVVAGISFSAIRNSPLPLVLGVMILDAVAILGSLFGPSVVVSRYDWREGVIALLVTIIISTLVLTGAVYLMAEPTYIHHAAELT